MVVGIHRFSSLSRWGRVGVNCFILRFRSTCFEMNRLVPCYFCCTCVPCCVVLLVSGLSELYKTTSKYQPSIQHCLHRHIKHERVCFRTVMIYYHSRYKARHDIPICRAISNILSDDTQFHLVYPHSGPRSSSSPHYRALRT